MYPNYYFYIKLTQDSDWFITIGHSLTEIMITIGHSLTEIMAHYATYDTMPYAYIKGNQL